MVAARIVPETDILLFLGCDMKYIRYASEIPSSDIKCRRKENLA